MTYSKEFFELSIGEPTHNRLPHSHACSTRIQIPNQHQGRNLCTMDLVSEIIAYPGLHVVEHDIRPCGAEAEPEHFAQPLLGACVANVRVD
ncbi:hypothetical protein D9M68_895970 [compost metagenome]